MEKTLFALMSAALLVAGLAGCGSSGTVITIGEQEAGKEIHLHRGDTLVIMLDGNVTTGFNWLPAQQYSAVLSQVGEPEVTPESAQLGAPGKIVLRFSAVGLGTTLLHLDYRRSWETGVAPEKTFEVTVVVE
jgi:inhibitor of cysteine peptidase